MNFNLSSLRQPLAAWVRHHPRQVVLAMLALLCFGVVLGVYRRYQAHRSLQQERLPRKELLETWPLVDVPTLRKGQQWLEWESRLEEIMQKDTLSREDSLFLQHVNESLNRELYSDENN